MEYDARMDVSRVLGPENRPLYQKDWTLYLGGRSPNHKNPVAIMQEMGDATGIDTSALVAFHPGTHRGRQDTRDIVVMHMYTRLLLMYGALGHKTSHITQEDGNSADAAVTMVSRYVLM